MSLVQQSNPIELADYAHANNLQNEPAFRWWTRKVLKKCDRIINKIKVCTRKPGRMNFGVKVPLKVEEALFLDKQNGNTLWHDAIEKEMKNSCIDFEVLYQDASVPVGYTKITCHLISDVNIDLMRKARYVVGSHLTDPPSNRTYLRRLIMIYNLVSRMDSLACREDQRGLY